MAKKQRALRIKKSQLAGLATWLNQIPLAGRDSRIRSRFVNELSQSMRITEKERMEIIGNYVKKKKDKKTNKEIWETTGDNENKQWVISPEKLEEFNKELGDLYAEEYVMNVTPETEENILKIKDILLNTDYKFGAKQDDPDVVKMKKVQEANDYVIWCEAFEAI